MNNCTSRNLITQIKWFYFYKHMLPKLIQEVKKSEATNKKRK